MCESICEATYLCVHECGVCVYAWISIRSIKLYERPDFSKSKIQSLNLNLRKGFPRISAGLLENKLSSCYLKAIQIHTMRSGTVELARFGTLGDLGGW